MNNTIEILQNQSSNEVRDFLKTNLNNPQVMDELIAQKETALPLLLKHKAYFDDLIKGMIQSPQDLEFFMDCCLDARFIPPYNYVEEVLNVSPKGEQIYQDLLQAFPSIPVTIQLMMSLINLGKSRAAIKTILVKPELQKPEILILMLKSQMIEDELIELAMNNEVVANKILDELAEALNSSYSRAVIPYPTKMINQVINKGDISGLNSGYVLKSLSSVLDESALVKVLELFRSQKAAEDAKNRYYHYRNYKESIEWSEVFEVIDDHLLKDFQVVEAPEGSKFRRSFILSAPNNGTDAELIEISQANQGASEKVMGKVLEEILSRSLNLIKQVNIETFENFLSPGELADAVRHKDGDYEKRIYLYGSLTSKYRPAIFKTMPKDKLPEVDTSRKKSYFFEAFQALKKPNLTEFHEALSHGYDLNNFVKDSKQSSKQKGCENLHLSHEFLITLTKEELLLLAQSPIKMQPSYRYRDEESEKSLYPYKFSVAEALILKDKIGENDAFANVDNQVEFLLSSGLPEDEFTQIAESFKSDIFNNSALLKAFLTRSTNGSNNTEFSSDMVKNLGKHLTAAEISKTIKLPQWNFSEYLNIKGIDGEYVVSYSMIEEKMKNKYTIEETAFIQALATRDPEYTKKIVAAYLKGNKGLSEFFGEAVNIRRGKLDFFKKLDLELNSNPEEMVEKYFAKGGKLSDFKSNLLNYEESLNLYGKDREVIVEQIDLTNIPREFEDLTGVQIKIERAEFGYSYYNNLDSDFYIPKNVKVQLISIGSNIDSDRMDKDAISVLISLNIPMVLDENIDAVSRLNLARKNFPGLTISQEAHNVINSLQTVKDWDVELCQLLEENGLMITEDLVAQFLEHHPNKISMMKWLSGRIGGLSKYMVQESDVTSYDSSEEERSSDEEKIEAMKSLGLQVVPDEDYKILGLKNTLKQSGGTFAPVDVSEFSLTQKSDLIKFIENEVDSRYKQLNLISSNIDTLEILTDYDSMKVCYSLDEADLIRLLNIPQNMQSKKFLKAFKDLVSIGGGGFTYKVDTLKRIVPIINPAVVLELTDFVDTDNVSSVKESETLSAISLQVMLKVEEFAEEIRNNKVFLKGQKKANIFRFLRTCSNYGDNYIRDILQMITAILNGVEGLELRVKTLKDEGSSDEDQQIITLNESITSLRSYLTEVAKMDDATHMHDRLVKMASFITSDPIQPLNTDKFNKFEKSKALEESLGYQLYFPKTRGDLQYLGDQNGWCVNRFPSYGDNVIKKGNILVGICEKGQPSARENVVALAHYTKNGVDSYSLEQLKWSSRKQGGRTNVDATGAFRHGDILNEIKTYLKEYNAKKAISGKEE